MADKIDYTKLDSQELIDRIKKGGRDQEKIFDEVSRRLRLDDRDALELVVELCQGDKEDPLTKDARFHLLDNFKPYIKTIILDKFTERQHDHICEELVHDKIDKKVYKGIATMKYQGFPSFKNWLATISNNASSDHFKKCRSSKVKIPLDSPDPPGNIIVATSTIIEEALADNETLRLILEARQDLTEDEWNAVVLFHFFEIGVKRSAKLLICSQGTISNWTESGGKKIGEFLEARGFDSSAYKKNVKPSKPSKKKKRRGSPPPKTPPCLESRAALWHLKNYVHDMPEEIEQDAILLTWALGKKVSDSAKVLGYTKKEMTDLIWRVSPEVVKYLKSQGISVKLDFII
ncbi:MAG: sigma-70 family RNA polymerase sigma factor [Candidatus Hydrogenedens sp.]|nr:sigma-70 family RNA polymerase sigma factor [Candidatus Hydrogenedens sp.]